MLHDFGGILRWSYACKFSEIFWKELRKNREDFRDKSQEEIHQNFWRKLKKKKHFFNFTGYCVNKKKTNHVRSQRQEKTYAPTSTCVIQKYLFENFDKSSNISLDRVIRQLLNS